MHMKVARLVVTCIRSRKKSLFCRLLLGVMALFPGLRAMYEYKLGNLEKSLALIGNKRPRLKSLRVIQAKCREALEVIQAPAPQPAPERDTRAWNNKVLFCLHYSLPHDTNGYARRSHSVLTKLRDRGVDVTACTRLNHPWDTARNPADIPLLDSVEGVDYHHLKDDAITISAQETMYFEAYARQIEDLARKIEPSVLHACSNFWNAEAAIRAAHKLGLKAFYEFRGLWHLTRTVYEPWFAQSDLYRYHETMERNAALRADQVLAISGPLRDVLLGWGVPEERITLAPNAVDPHLFTPLEPDMALKRELGLEGKTVLGFIGSITAYEGLDLLIEAMPGLLKKGIKVALLVVGSGADAPALKAKAHDLGLDDNVLFPGRVPHDQVQRYYSIMDILPYPRLDLPLCATVPPLKVLEAMAMEKAVIVSDLPPLTEMVTDQETGLVCRAGDAASLQRTVEQLAADPDLGTRLGKQARAWAMEHRSWDRVIDSFARLYETGNKGRG